MNLAHNKMLDQDILFLRMLLNMECDEEEENITTIKVQKNSALLNKYLQVSTLFLGKMIMDVVVNMGDNINIIFNVYLEKV